MSPKAETVDHLVKVFRSLAKYPTPISGRILNQNKAFGAESTHILSTWSQRNLEQGKAVTFQRSHLLIPGQTENVQFLPVDVSSELSSSLSGSEAMRAVIRNRSSEAPVKQFLEIWSNGRLTSNLDLSSLDLHGQVYADGEFGCLEWSKDERKIAYIAEKKAVKAEPFYKQKSIPSTEKDDAPTVVRGGEYIYKPDWGEQLVGKSEPVIVVHEVGSETLLLPTGVPNNYSPGQLVWGSGGDVLYGIAVEHEPRRLGLIYCTCRTSYIFKLTLQGEFKLLSDEGMSARSPRLSPNGRSLIWVQRRVGGPHHGCQQLIQYDLATGQKTIIVDFVKKEDENGFCGLYLGLQAELPKRCFTSDGTKVVVSSPCKTVMRSYSIDLASKKVVALPWEKGGSLVVLDVSGDSVLARASSLQKPSWLVLTNSVDAPVWREVTNPETVLVGSQLRITTLQADNTGDSFRELTSLYIGPPAPKDGSTIPLIVYPHGGPHACSTDSFYLEAAFLVTLNMGVLYVNYRGSTGFGDDGVNFLPGRIGDTDVKDVHQAAKEVLAALPHLDGDRVGLCGGSHGGFLVAHLSAQYPDFYKAVVTRNPAVNVANMYATSDIPDWAVVESCGGNFVDDSKPLTVEVASRMAEVSPMRLTHQIKAPTLYLLGQKDLRVPIFQGISHYNALRARNVTTQVYLYEDNHPLAKVPVEMDSTIHSGLWLLEHLAEK